MDSQNDELEEVFEVGDDLRTKFLDKASQSLVEHDNLREVELTTDEQALTIAEVFVDETDHAYMLYFAVDEGRPAGFSIFHSDEGTLLEGRSLDTAVERLEEIVDSKE